MDFITGTQGLEEAGKDSDFFTSLDFRGEFRIERTEGLLMLTIGFDGDPVLTGDKVLRGESDLRGEAKLGMSLDRESAAESDSLSDEAVDELTASVAVVDAVTAELDPAAAEVFPVKPAAVTVAVVAAAAVVLMLMILFSGTACRSGCPPLPCSC